MSALLSGVRLDIPRSVEEAVAMRRRNPSTRYIAGGTDLLVNLRRGIAAPDMLIDITGIAELGEISGCEHGLVIGAGVNIATLAQHPEIGARYRALADAAGAIAGPGHRTIATVGGNLCLDTRCIYYNQSEWWRRANNYCLKHGGTVCHVAPQGQRCHAAYSGDLAPALLVLGAKVEIAGADGRRRIPLSELYVEDGRAHLALQDGELVTAVWLPPDPPASLYAKLRTRAAIDFPLSGIAVALAKSDAEITTLKIALTATNSRPFLLAGTDAMAGRKLDDTLLRDIERMVKKQVQPMRTTLASANYRRLGAAGLAVRLIGELSACPE
jgi:4-hydroxybenzoyl-CoA reductase subunit beta